MCGKPECLLEDSGQPVDHGAIRATDTRNDVHDTIHAHQTSKNSSVELSLLSEPPHLQQQAVAGPVLPHIPNQTGAINHRPADDENHEYGTISSACAFLSKPVAPPPPSPKKTEKVKGLGTSLLGYSIRMIAQDVCSFHIVYALSLNKYTRAGKTRHQRVDGFSVARAPEKNSTDRVEKTENDDEPTQSARQHHERATPHHPRSRTLIPRMGYPCGSSSSPVMRLACFVLSSRAVSIDPQSKTIETLFRASVAARTDGARSLALLDSGGNLLRRDRRTLWYCRRRRIVSNPSHTSSSTRGGDVTGGSSGGLCRGGARCR